jgi:membrane protein YqaA with SNARE-associated domain
MPVQWIALLWGFAEATLFFVVPDVLLTFVALRNLRRALVACGVVLLGALAGGVLMYTWADRHPEAARSAVERVPAISAGLMQAVAGQLREQGPLAAVVGAFVGRPYKIYAVTAAGAGISLPVFALITVPARLSRFVLLTLLAALGARLLRKRLSARRLDLVLGGIWVVNYAIYWTIMGW